MEPCHWLAEVFRKTQMGGGFDAARGQPARDQIVLLPVSCLPPSRPTGHLGPPCNHCGLGGGALRARGSPRIAAGEASPGVRVHLGRPRRHLMCFGPAAGLRPAPPPRPTRTRGPPGTVEHWRSLQGRAALPPSGPTSACATPITCFPPACLSGRRRRLLPLLPLPHSC